MNELFQNFSSMRDEDAINAILNLTDTRNSADIDAVAAKLMDNDGANAKHFVAQLRSLISNSTSQNNAKLICKAIEHFANGKEDALSVLTIITYEGSLFNHTNAAFMKNKLGSIIMENTNINALTVLSNIKMGKNVANARLAEMYIQEGLRRREMDASEQSIPTPTAVDESRPTWREWTAGWVPPFLSGRSTPPNTQPSSGPVVHQGESPDLIPLEKATSRLRSYQEPLSPQRTPLETRPGPRSHESLEDLARLAPSRAQALAENTEVSSAEAGGQEITSSSSSSSPRVLTKREMWTKTLPYFLETANAAALVIENRYAISYVCNTMIPQCGNLTGKALSTISKVMQPVSNHSTAVISLTWLGLRAFTAFQDPYIFVRYVAVVAINEQILNEYSLTHANSTVPCLLAAIPNAAMGLIATSPLGLAGAPIVGLDIIHAELQCFRGYEPVDQNLGWFPYAVDLSAMIFMAKFISWRAGSIHAGMTQAGANFGASSRLIAIVGTVSATAMTCGFIATVDSSARMALSTEVGRKFHNNRVAISVVSGGLTLGAIGFELGRRFTGTVLREPRREPGDRIDAGALVTTAITIVAAGAGAGIGFGVSQLPSTLVEDSWNNVTSFRNAHSEIFDPIVGGILGAITGIAGSYMLGLPVLQAAAFTFSMTSSCVACGLFTGGATSATTAGLVLIASIIVGVGIAYGPAIAWKPTAPIGLVDDAQPQNDIAPQNLGGDVGESLPQSSWDTISLGSSAQSLAGTEGPTIT